MNNSHAVSQGSSSPISRSPSETQKKNDNNDRTISYPIADQAPVRSGIQPSLTLEDRWELLKRFDAKELLGMSSDTRTNPTDVERGNGVYDKRWTLLPTETGYEPKPLPGKVSADEQHFTIWTFGNQSSVARREPIRSSRLGQLLYAHGYRHTSQGLQRYDGKKPYEKQPDINAALQKIDRLSSAGLLKLRMTGGVGEKKSLRSSLPKNPFMTPKEKLEKALETWVAEGKKMEAYRNVDWDRIAESLKVSFDTGGMVNMWDWGPLPSSYFMPLATHLKHVKTVTVKVTNAEHANQGAPSLSMLENFKGLKKVYLHIEESSSGILENLPRLKNLNYLHVNGKSLSRVEECLANIAQRFPQLSYLLIKLESNPVEISNRTGADLGAINGFTRLAYLELHGKSVSNDTMRVIGKIKNLKRLELCKTSINDQAAPHFMALQNLKTFSVNSSNVSDRVMRAIASLPKISILSIINASISSEALSSLANCSLKSLSVLRMKKPCKLDEQALSGSKNTLMELRLDETSSPDASIAYLRKFNKLLSLQLGGKAVSDESIKALKGLPLSELELCGPAISDDAAKSIRYFTGLQKCSIINAAVSDKFLHAFDSMKNLYYVNLKGAKITDNGIEQWKEYLSSSNIVDLHLDETLITEKGLNILLNIPLNELWARRSQVKSLPEKLMENDGVLVDLRGIEFDSSTLQTLRTLENVEYDDPDDQDDPDENSDSDDDQTSLLVSEDATNINSHWQAMMDRFNPNRSNQESLRSKSVNTYLSYPDEVKNIASVRSEMVAKRQEEINAQMRGIVSDANCTVFYKEAIDGIERYFALLKNYRPGLGKFSVKMDIQTPGAAITNVIDAFGAQVPGVGAMTSSINQIAEAYGIRNFNRWCEGVSRHFDATRNIKMIADTLARAMTHWYKNDLNDAEWVAKNSDQTKYLMQVQDFVKGVGQSYTKHERHIMHLVERQLNWLFNELGRLADEEGGVNLAEAIDASIEVERDKLEKRQGKQKQTDGQSVSGRLILLDTDHLKIKPILEALVKKFPRSGQDALKPALLSQELAKLIIWGKRDKLIPWNEVNERAMQKQARSSASNWGLSTPVLTQEPQSAEEQGDSVSKRLSWSQQTVSSSGDDNKSADQELTTDATTLQSTSEPQLALAQQNATIEEQRSIISKQQKSIETLENTVAEQGRIIATQQKSMETLENTVAELQKQMEAILKILPGKQ